MANNSMLVANQTMLYTNRTLESLSRLDKLAVVLNSVIYDNTLIRVLGINPVYVPSLVLGSLAVYSLVVGCYATIKKPRNAEEANPYHPLFDPTDLEGISQLETVDETKAFFMPAVLACVLLSLSYGLKNFSKETILNFFNKYIFVVSIVANYSTLTYAMKCVNRILSYKLGINPLDFIAKYRLTLSKDPRVNPTSVVVDEKKLQADLDKLYESVFNLVGLKWVYAKYLKSAEQTSAKHQEKAKKTFDKTFLPVEREDQLVNVFFSSAEYYALPLSSALAFFYYLNSGSQNWILSTLFGVSYAVFGIKTSVINSFKTGAILLVGLFFYDVYFVFGTTVMVDVATQLEIPAKLSFPGAPAAPLGQYVPRSSMHMLGLGDIVVPGMFVSLCLRYDLFRFHEANPKTEFHHLTEFPKPYFCSALAGYIVGLLSTMVSLHYFKVGQPALLYICPSILAFTFALAFSNGEISKLWAFSEDKEQKPSKRKQEKPYSKQVSEIDLDEILEIESEDETPATWDAFLTYDLPEENELEDATYVYSLEEEIDEADDSDEFSEYDDDE